MDPQRDTTRQATSAAGEQASAMWREAKDVAREAAGSQQQAAARGIDDFAGVLRQAARDTDGGQSPATKVAASLADGLERLSSNLRSRDMNSLIRDAEDFARQQPLLFFGAALAVGFVAMRFLNSSAPASGSRAMDESMPASRGDGLGGSLADDAPPVTLP